MKTLKESLFDADLAKKDPIPTELQPYQHPKDREELVLSIGHTIEYYKSINHIKKGDTIDLNWIDVSKIYDMSNTFNMSYISARIIHLSDYNYDISKWNVSKVISMWGMFVDCRYFNCDISKWNIKNVRYMEFMFTNCPSFDQDLSGWNIKKAISSKKKLHKMFEGCDKMKPEHLPSIA